MTAVELLGSRIALPQVSLWELAVKSADQLREQGRYQKAEQSYREALREAQALEAEDAEDLEARSKALLADH